MLGLPGCDVACDEVGQERNHKNARGKCYSIGGYEMRESPGSYDGQHHEPDNGTEATCTATGDDRNELNVAGHLTLFVWGGHLTHNVFTITWYCSLCRRRRPRAGLRLTCSRYLVQELRLRITATVVDEEDGNERAADDEAEYKDDEYEVHCG